jgi:hypothetical protein
MGHVERTRAYSKYPMSSPRYTGKAMKTIAKLTRTAKVEMYSDEVKR